MEQRYFPIFDNRDYRWANKLTLKTAFLTLLFDDRLYIVDLKRPSGVAMPISARRGVLSCGSSRICGTFCRSSKAAAKGDGN